MIHRSATHKLILGLATALLALCTAAAVILLSPPAHDRTAHAQAHTEHADDWAEVTSAGGALSSGSYFLSGDTDLTNNLTVSGTVTLCLNGYMLRGNGSGSVITVESGAHFTLCDCCNTTEHHYYVDSSGKYVFVTDTTDANYTAATQRGIISGGVITGGTITGNTADSGGGVEVDRGIFTMHSGTISDNTANSGGGVDVYIATFTMQGGTISNNTASSEGGGVNVDEYANFTMEGGYFGENDIVISGGTVSITGGYFAGDPEAYVTAGYIVGTTHTVITLSDENSYDDADYVSGYPYAVYAIGTGYAVEDVSVTYGESYGYAVTNPTGAAVTYSAEKPANAGNYTMTATFAEFIDSANKTYYAEQRVDFTVSIAAATPSCTTPANLSVHTGFALSSVTLPEGWAWKDGTAIVTESGEFAAVYTPTDTANYVIVEENIAVTAEAHAWGDWTVSKEATATEKGERVSECTVCGEGRREAIPATGEAAPPATGEVAPPATGEVAPPATGEVAPPATDGDGQPSAKGEPAGRSGGATAAIAVGSTLGALALAYGICLLLFKKGILKGAFFEKIYPFLK